ncbi:MAG: hypothetical protein WA949_23770 [Phormidesmis sp.]
MHRLTLTIPDEIHAQMKDLAKSEGVSVSQYVTYMIASKVEQTAIRLLAADTQPESDSDEIIAAASPLTEVAAVRDTPRRRRDLL